MIKEQIVEKLRKRIAELEETGAITSYLLDVGDTIDLTINSSWYGGDTIKEEIKVEEESGKITFDNIEFKDVDQFINLVLA